MMFASDVYCERVKYFDLHLIKITQLFCIAQQTELLISKFSIDQDWKSFMEDTTK